MADWIEAKNSQIEATLAQFQAGLLPGGILTQHAMTRAPDCVSETTSVLEIVRGIHERRTHHTLVTSDQGQLTGVISDRDVIRCFGPGAYPDHQALESLTARDIMSTDLITAAPELPLVESVGMLLDFGIGCLPIIRDDRLVGILTLTDVHILLRMLLRALPHPAAANP